MLLEATSGIATRITGAIRQAAQATGASFEYLLKTAQRESNFNPAVKAATSSATGLFQFIDQTWLGTLKSDGAALGYGRYAERIERTAAGRYVVQDPAARRAIMRLRTDPAAASAMAGAFTKRNAAYLSKTLGRKPTDGELYIAHFLGPAGAAQLIAAAERSPRTRAAEMFPAAARANRSIFYAQGAPRSAAQVYGMLVAKHQNTRVPPGVAAPTMVAEAAGQRAARKPAAAAEPPFVSAYAGETGPVFHNMFRTGRDVPVSAFVTEMWTAKGAPAPVARAAAPSRPAAGRPLDLFQFLRPSIQARASRPA